MGRLKTMRPKAAMTCEFCDGTVERRVILTDFHYMGRTIYVDSVPAWVCTQCGEAYFEETEVNAVQNIIRAVDEQTGKLARTA